MSLTDSAEGLSLSTLMDNPTMLIVVGLVIFVILFIIVFVVALFAGKRKASSVKRKSGKIDLNPADFPDADFNKPGNGNEGKNADSSSAIAFTPVSSSPVSSSASAPARESPEAQEVSSPASASAVVSQPRRQRAVDDDDDFVYVSPSRDADTASAGTGAAGVSSSFRQTSQSPAVQNQAAQPQNSPFRAQPYPEEQPAASSPFRASDAAASSAIAATAVAAAAADDESGVEVYGNEPSEPVPQEQPAYAQSAQPAYAPLPEDPFMHPSQAPAEDEGVEILGEKPAAAPAPSARTRRSADAFFIDRKKKEPVKEPEPLFEDEPSGIYIKPNEPSDDPFANAYERPRRPAFDELRLNRAADSAAPAVGVAAEAVAFSNESEPESAEFAEVCSSEENAPNVPENEIADEFDEVADEAVFERAPAAGFSVAAAPVVVDDATETGMGETIVAPVDTESSRCENMDGGVEMWKESKPETHEAGNGGKYAFYDSVIREENEKRANAEFEAIGATPEDRFAAVAESIRNEETGNGAEISEEPKSVFGKPEDGTSDPDY